MLLGKRTNGVNNFALALVVAGVFMGVFFSGGLAGVFTGATDSYGADGGYAVFSTKNHPKANGLDIEVSYPKGFTPEEAEGYNVIQTFNSGGDDPYFVILSLQLKELEPQMAKDVVELYRDKSYVENVKSELSKIHDVVEFFSVKTVKKNKLDGLSASFMTNIKDGEIYALVDIMETVFKNNLVTSMCFAADPMGSPDLKKNHAKISKDYCGKFFDSLKLLN
jgi:hypothetical protein